MKAVYRKEMRQYFHSVIGYVFLAIFVFINAFYFLLQNLLTRSGDITDYFRATITLEMFLMPMLTMRSFSAEKKQKTDLLSFTFSAPENKCLHNLLTREAAEVVFGMDEEVYEFCSRSLINPSFIHHMTPQLALWKQQSRMLIPRQLYVVLHRKMMDVVCFAQGKLLFVNTFEYDKPDDILYYILYVWRCLPA